MAAPVINSTQSVLGYLQWEAWTFQPFAMNSPKTWTSSPLPPGLSLNSSTGALSGAVSSPGVYIVALTATNVEGSGSAVFTIGIEASAPTTGADMDVVFDVVTHRVGRSVAVPPQGAPAVLPDSLTVLKYNDDWILSVTLAKAGVTLDLDVTALTLRIKELETDAVLVTSDAWLKVGSGGDTRFRVHSKIAGSALKAALSNYENDVETEFQALCELEVTWNNALSATFAPATLTVSSDTFRVAIARNFRP
jgi:hypothetical protein